MVELNKRVRTLSWTLAVTSIIKCQWGIGMMAIPFMLQQGGLYFGMAQFIAAMFLTADGILRLIAVKSAILERAEPLQQLQHDSSTTPCARSVPFVTEDWLDMTGADATGSPKVGARFTAWDGYIEGTTLELDRPRRFVQSWRTSQFAASDADSRLVVQLEAVPGGTQVTIDHSSLPPDQVASYLQGWDTHYFTPMRAWFADRG